MGTRSRNPVVLGAKFQFQDVGKKVKAKMAQQVSESRRIARDIKLNDRRFARLDNTTTAEMERQSQRTSGKLTKSKERTDAMLLWKANRLREKELLQKKNKHEFVVKHMAYEPAGYLVGIKSGPVTRSYLRSQTLVNKEAKKIPSVTKGHSAKPPEITKKKENGKKEYTQKGTKSKGKILTKSSNGRSKDSTDINILPTVDSPQKSVENYKEEKISNESVILDEKVTACAPSDDKFVPPDGIGSFLEYGRSFRFNLNPLSPASADNFFRPSCTSLELHVTSDSKGATEDHKTSVPFTKEVVNSSLSALPCPNEDPIVQFRSLVKPMVKQSPIISSATLSNIESNFLGDNKIVSESTLTPTAVEKSSKLGGKSHLLKIDPSIANEGGDIDTPGRTKSASYFTSLMQKVTNKLSQMSSDWETDLKDHEEITEEVHGTIRTVIGQAQLLMDQRFTQFRDLINLHQDKTAEKGATSSDLQGFWDMIYYQVEDVYKKFDDLSKLKANNWVVEEPVKITKPRKKNIKKPAPAKPAPAESTKSMIAKKKRIEDMRKFKMSMKAKLSEPDTTNSDKPEDVACNLFAEDSLEKKPEDVACNLFAEDSLEKRKIPFDTYIQSTDECNHTDKDEDAHKETVKRDLMRTFDDSKENKGPLHLNELDKQSLTRKSIGHQRALLIKEGNRNTDPNILLSVSPNDQISKLAAMKLDDSISRERTLFTPPLISKTRQSLLPENLMEFSPRSERKRTRRSTRLTQTPGRNAGRLSIYENKVPRSLSPIILSPGRRHSQNFRTNEISITTDIL